MPDAAVADPVRIALPGQVRGLAATGPAGPVYVTSNGGQRFRTVLTAIDLSGTVRWQRSFLGHPFPPRATADGVVWLPCLGPDGPVLVATGADGAQVHAVALPADRRDRLGAFAVLAGGFCVAWTAGPAPRTGRVDRLDGDGNRLWSTVLPLTEVAYEGVVEMGVPTGWKIRPKPPWRPKRLRIGRTDPLLVSGDRILASYDDDHSGVGLCYFISTDTGELIATTRPGPTDHKAVVTEGEFLVGAQGYGAFSTTRYDRDGAAVVRWQSHGALLVGDDGDIRGVELENRLPSQSRFRGLDPDGSLTDGPPLSGYYTTYPAMDSDGVAVFWRDGKLQTVDRAMTRREIFRAEDDRVSLSRILLLDDGAVCFGVADELLIFRTRLGPLHPGSWPCGDGNVYGNPVVYA